MITNNKGNKRSYMRGYIYGMQDVLNDIVAIERHCNFEGIENSGDGINLIHDFDSDCYEDEIFEFIDALLDILSELRRADEMSNDNYSSDGLNKRTLSQIILGHDQLKTTMHYKPKDILRRQ